MKRIKELREKSGMSQLSLATKVGCSQNTISKIEKGECDPKASILVEMSKFFGVSVDYLLGLDDIDTSDELNSKFNRLSPEAQDLVLKLVDLLEYK